MSITAAAAALADQVQAALTTAGLDAAATTNPDDAFTAAASGSGAVLVGPPALVYSGVPYGTRDATFTVTVAYRGAGAWDAWQHIDTLLSVVAATVDLESARPAQLTAPNVNGDPIPAYIAQTHPFALESETTP